MNADTFDGNINLLSIEECRKTKAHSDITLEEFLENIIHEFVHSCQQEINPDSKNVEWFWEALATNLGNPFDHTIDFQFNEEQLINDFNSVPNNYEIVFTIGKYLLENYIDLEHLPSMYELEYEFGMHEYDSYDYAYLMVCYLIEKMGKDKFLIVIKSKENIELLSEDLVLKSVNYFCNKYHCNIESDHLIESTYNSNNSLV